MARMVHCVKLGKELPGVERKPYNNALGQRLYDNVSQEAWRLWLEHFKMVMNENRLDPSNPKTFEVLFVECEKYFFGEGAELPPGYVPQAASK